MTADDLLLPAQHASQPKYCVKFDVLMPALLNHLHNVETRFDCPQTCLYLDFQCRDDVSKYKTF